MQYGSDEVEYESAPSEGGFESASDRGREVLPRVISASHCVEVYKQYCWADSWSSEFADYPDGHEGQGPLAAPLKFLDPFHDMPAKIMRFDGAIEAWLEEMPLPRSLNLSRPYASLNDAAARQDLPVLRTGNGRATIWYFTHEFVQRIFPLMVYNDDNSGIRTWEKLLVEGNTNIRSTHVEFARVHCPAKSGKDRQKWLKSVFSALQACKWSPNGEARILILKERLSHASMSIGDIVQVGRELYIAGLEDFVTIKEVLAPTLSDVGELEASFQTLESVDAESSNGVEELPRASKEDFSGDNANYNKSSDTNDNSGKKFKRQRKSKGGAKGANAATDADGPEETTSKGDLRNRKSLGGKGKADGKTAGKAGGKPGGKGAGEADARSSVGGGAGPASAAAASKVARGGRADRRALRAKLQAEREAHYQ